MNDRKNEILEEVLERLLSGASPTMIDLVEQISVSRKTLYNYFANREELLTLVTERYFEKTEERIAQIVASDVSYVTRAKELFNLIPKSMADIEILSSHKKGDLNSINEFGLRAYSRLKVSVEEFIREGQREGHFKNDLKASRVTDLFFTLVKGDMVFGKQLSEDPGVTRFPEYAKMVFCGIVENTSDFDFQFSI